MRQPLKGAVALVAVCGALLVPLSARGNAQAAPQGQPAGDGEGSTRPPEIPKLLSFLYLLPPGKTCFISMGIFTRDGDLLRTLLTGEQRTGGTVIEKWDGLDDQGRVLPAGRYEFKALAHFGISQEWVVSLHNAGNPPWVTADGTGSWGGDSGTPIDVAVCGDRVYLLWTGASAGWDLIACSLDGRKQWGMRLDQGYRSGGCAVAAASNVVYVSQGKGVTTYDTGTGHSIGFAGGRRAIDIPGGMATDLAVDDGHLYVLASNTVHDIDLQLGQIVRALPIRANVKGLAAVPGADVLLTAGTAGLHRLNLQTGAADLLFAASLAVPFDVAVSADAKTVFVSDRAKGEQTVKAFSYPGGKPLGTVGKPGGRPPVGKYDAAGVFNPAGIACDGGGRVWVTEDDSSPKRVSVWTTDGWQGKLAAEYFGPTACSVGVSADPLNPDYVYLHNTRWIVDYEKRSATLDCTFARPGYAGPQPTLNGAGGFIGQTIRIRHFDGRTFLHDGNSVWEMLDDHAVPLYAWMRFDDSTSRLPIPVALRMSDDRVIYWHDLNRDGIMQAAEFVGGDTTSVYAVSGGCGQNMGNDLAIEHGTGRQTVKEWRQGLPIWSKCSEMRPFATQGKIFSSQWNVALTRCYVLEEIELVGQMDIHRSGLSCYASDGKRLWRFQAGVGKDLSAPLTKPGQVRGAQKIIGIVDTGAHRAGELIGVNGYYGNYNLVSEDGLFVAEFCHDNRRKPELDATVVCPEDRSGFLVKHPRSGKYYLMGGDTDGRIWELRGLNSLRRFSGQVDVSDKDVEAATQARAEHEKALDASATNAKPLRESR